MNAKRLILQVALLCAAWPAVANAITAAEIMALPLAQRSEKLGVPADVRYRVMGQAKKDAAVDVEFFVILGADGRNLKLEYPVDNAVVLGRGTRNFSQKTFEKSETLVRRVSITPTTAGETGLRFILSMDIGASRYFTVFTIPIDADQP